MSSEEKKLINAPECLPWVESAMLTAEYWIGIQNNPDEIIMTPKDIKKFNDKVKGKKVVFRDWYGKTDPLKPQFHETEVKGPVMNPLTILDLPETLPGDSLKVRLKSNIEWLNANTFYDSRPASYSDGMKQKITERMNIGNIPQVITRRLGIVVNHGDIRHYPTAEPGYLSREWFGDFFQATALLIGDPVAILHTSKDGDFYYIESPISRGWVSSDTIALAPENKVHDLTQTEQFLMATADKVPVYGDSLLQNFVLYFYFSERFPLEKHGRTGYKVTLPYRKSDGSLGITSGYVKPDADVNIGYLPYTKRNILTQIFKLLNTPYGWADQDNKRDCSGTQRVLLRCFGIVTGRHPSFVLSASDHQIYLNPALTQEEKIVQIASLEPVITMAGSSGHIALFLGKAKNGEYYFIHQVGWGYEDTNGDYLTVARVAVSCIDHEFFNVEGTPVFTTFKP